jgi:hypothetical protein
MSRKDVSLLGREDAAGDISLKPEQRRAECYDAQTAHGRYESRLGDGTSGDAKIYWTGRTVDDRSGRVRLAAITNGIEVTLSTDQKAVADDGRRRQGEFVK